jgi:hypothetical protein
VEAITCQTGTDGRRHGRLDGSGRSQVRVENGSPELERPLPAFRLAILVPRRRRCRSSGSRRRKNAGSGDRRRGGSTIRSLVGTAAGGLPVALSWRAGRRGGRHALTDGHCAPTATDVPKSSSPPEAAVVVAQVLQAAESKAVKAPGRAGAAWPLRAAGVLDGRVNAGSGELVNRLRAHAMLESSISATRYWRRLNPG